MLLFVLKNFCGYQLRNNEKRLLLYSQDCQAAWEQITKHTLQARHPHVHFALQALTHIEEPFCNFKSNQRRRDMA